MLYAIRGADGAIQTLSRQELAGAVLLAESDPEVQQFLAEGRNSANFNALDADFVRVIEDVIDTLIQNKVIKLTDLPEAAQKKLNARKGVRNKLAGALNLLGDDSMIL